MIKTVICSARGMRVRTNLPKLGSEMTSPEARLRAPGKNCPSRQNQRPTICQQRPSANLYFCQDRADHLWQGYVEWKSGTWSDQSRKLSCGTSRRSQFASPFAAHCLNADITMLHAAHAWLERLRLRARRRWREVKRVDSTSDIREAAMRQAHVITIDRSRS